VGLFLFIALILGLKLLHRRHVEQRLRSLSLGDVQQAYFCPDAIRNPAGVSGTIGDQQRRELHALLVGLHPSNVTLRNIRVSRRTEICLPLREDWGELHFDVLSPEDRKDLVYVSLSKKIGPNYFSVATYQSQQLAMWLRAFLE
jgi:hypothetical protein